MIEANMRTYLDESTSMTSTFYLRVATQDAVAPYGVVFKVSPGKDYTHSGSGLSQSRLQCSCFADTYYAAKTMARQVITDMEAWSTKSTTATSTGVQTVFLDGEVDLFDDDSKVFHVALDFFIWHTQ
jgi:hypothetical protein